MVTVSILYEGTSRRKLLEKEILSLASKYHGDLIDITEGKSEMRMNFDFAYPSSAITFVGKGCTEGLFTVPD